MRRTLARLNFPGSLKTRLASALALSMMTAPAFVHAQGSWGGVIEWDHVASTIANMEDGRIVSWNSADILTAELNDSGVNPRTVGAIWNPDTGNFTSINNDSHNMFCAGVSMIEDGSVVVVGGVPDNPNSSLFDPDLGGFQRLANLNENRYYPTTLTLPTNDIFAGYARGERNTQPASAFGDRHVDITTSEVYDTSQNNWDYVNTNHELLELERRTSDETAVNNSTGHQWYTNLAMAPDGRILQAGPNPTWHWYDPINDIAEEQIGQPTGGVQQIYGNMVNYDIGKMMLIGGSDETRNPATATNRVYMIDMNGTNPVVTQGTPMRQGRSFANAVIMANGEILVVGGEQTGQIYENETWISEAEIFNTITETWRTAGNIAVPRVYHSTAILMKDGRVISAGGGACDHRANCDGVVNGFPPINQKNAQIYTPEYLLNANGTLRARPTFNAVSRTVTAGTDASFNLRVKSANGSNDSTVSRFTLLRLSATTHHFNADMRFIPLEFTRNNNLNANGRQYTVQIPTNQNVLLPGKYWLYAFDENGTPTEGMTVNVNAGNYTPRDISVGGGGTDPGAGAATANQACIFDNADYSFNANTGVNYRTCPTATRLYNMGNANNANNHNDSASAISVGSNRHLILHADLNGGGTSVCYGPNSDVNNLGALNNDVSSVTVGAGACPTNIPTPDPVDDPGAGAATADQACIFDNADYSFNANTGVNYRTCPTAVRLYNMGNANNANNHNDSASAISVGSNRHLILHADLNGGGISVCYGPNSDVNDLGALNNAVSSVTVGAGACPADAPDPIAGDFVPDPNKLYHIDNPAHGLRLAAVSGSEDLVSTTFASSGDNTQWRFVQSSVAGLWHIDRAAGGNTPRIRTDLSTSPDMQATSSSGTWTRFSIEANPDRPGTFLLTVPQANTTNQRLRLLGNGTTDFATNNNTGNNPSFVFTEVN